MNFIQNSGKFIDNGEKFVSLFSVIPNILTLVTEEKQKKAFLDNTLELFFSLINENTIND